jgi:hypothetical protein
MKTRMIAILMILAVAAWIPTTAQQNTAPQPAAQQVQAPSAPADSGKNAGKNGCACCQEKKDQNKGSEAAKSMSCCEGKEMTCCKKDSNDKQTAMNCCAGKDGKQCAKKDGKGCCGKDAMACNSKDGRDCCAGHAMCSHGSAQS